jgi:hypothetical protein
MVQRVKVSISPSLEAEIYKKFKGQSPNIIKFLMSLEENHHKGDFITQIGGVAIKEIKHSGFRFYYVIDNYRLKLFDKGELEELFIKFLKMSSKKTQQKVIDQIKNILRKWN